MHVPPRFMGSICIDNSLYFDMLKPVSGPI